MGRVQFKKFIAVTTIFAVFTILGGCAAVHTSIAKKDLDVQTKMSDTVFLDPVGPDKKTIYVEIRNTSDKSNFDIQRSIVHNLQVKGYNVTTDPDYAHYWLRANVLSVDKTSPTAAENALHAGYGGAITGAAVGAATGAALGGWSGAGIGGLAGAAAFGIAETVADAAVHDVTYMAITDIEIAEKAKEGVIVRQDSKQHAKQGIGGGRTQTSSEISDKKQYRVRVVSTANQVNLEYQEAAPSLTEGLTRSISGIF
jgi:hypothetical protein